MFGPVRGPWPDDSWKGWWGEEPPYHVPVFVLTHHARAPLEMKGGTTFYFVTDGLDSALRAGETCGSGQGCACRRRCGDDSAVSRGRSRLTRCTWRCRRFCWAKGRICLPGWIGLAWVSCGADRGGGECYARVCCRRGRRSDPAGRSLRSRGERMRPPLRRVKSPTLSQKYATRMGQPAFHKTALTLRLVVDRPGRRLRLRTFRSLSAWCSVATAVRGDAFSRR